MRKGDEKRQAILDVAEKLFYTKGYEATSVQDILDVLDTSKGSFYHHFESKEQVLATLCAQRAARAVTQAKEALAAEETPLDKLRTVFFYAMPLRKGEEKFLSLLLPLLDKPEGLSVRVRYQDALREGFHDLMAAGSVPGSGSRVFPGQSVSAWNDAGLDESMLDGRSAGTAPRTLRGAAAGTWRTGGCHGNVPLCAGAYPGCALWCH